MIIIRLSTLQYDITPTCSYLRCEYNTEDLISIMLSDSTYIMVYVIYIMTLTTFFFFFVILHSYNTYILQLHFWDLSASWTNSVHWKWPTADAITIFACASRIFGSTDGTRVCLVSIHSFMYTNKIRFLSIYRTLKYFRVSMKIIDRNLQVFHTYRMKIFGVIIFYIILIVYPYLFVLQLLYIVVSTLGTWLRRNKFVKYLYNVSTIAKKLV